MKKMTLILSVVCASPFLLFLNTPAYAHNGATNSANCHHAPPNGAYHCHNSEPDPDVRLNRDRLIGCHSSLSHGNEGSLVRAVQEDLTDLGYTFNMIDGIFGDETEQIVKSFQRGENLSETGVVECETYRQIQNELRNK